MKLVDAVRNGTAAMKEAAMQSLAVSAELRSSARRSECAGARREPCMLNDRSSAKVGLEPESIGTEPDVRAVRAGSTRPSVAQKSACTARHSMCTHNIFLQPSSNSLLEQIKKQHRRQSVMSKKVQGSTSKEGSGVAKTRPMNLVSKNLLSAKEDPPQDLSCLDSPRMKNWITVALHPGTGN